VIGVQLCCNDENGIDTGRVIRVDFDQYELECEDINWPPRGVSLRFRAAHFAKRRNNTQIKIGRDIWRDIAGIGGGGNIFWISTRMSGADCIGLMNYLMRLKYWHATAGECYLFDHFNEKKPIVHSEFFKSREE
jgi:hypothetical protein